MGFDSPCLPLGFLLYLILCLLFFSVNMSSSEDGSYSISHKSGLQGSMELSLDRVVSMDHKEEDIPFRIVCRTGHRLVQVL